MVSVSKEWLPESTSSDTPIEWEEVNCPLCSGEHACIVVEAADHCPGGRGLHFAVVRCRECGLCYTNPRPSEASIGQFYPASYRPHQPAGDGHQARRLRHHAALPRWLVRKHAAIPLHGQGRLLDFGCGGGRFLERMRQCGWRTTGIDLSAALMRRLRHERGLDAHAGSLPHPDLPPESFDVITMWHSLEHVHQPRQVLRAACDLLVPGGRLIVAVPNIESLAFDWFGASWYGLDLPRHLTHFGPDTLRDMLQCCGFAADPVRMVRHSSWLRWSARRAAPTRATLGQRLCEARFTSRLVSWFHYWTRQSDCILATGMKS